jgi:membrane-associated phospholipid phosphatase
MDFKFQLSKFRFLFLICIFSFSAFSAEPSAFAKASASGKPTADKSADKSDVNDTNAPTPATGNFWKDAKAFPKTALSDAQKAYFNSNNLLLLLMAGGGSIALHDKADETIAGHFERHRSIPQDLDNITDIAGSPGIHFAATGIWYLMASNKNDNLNLQRSWVMARALAVTDVTTLILKSTVQNHTPNGEDWAWPSGHTASSFCVASVLDEFYGPKVGIPAYLLAGFVGYRMMDSGDHWASDVLFGGVLGYVVGHAIAGEHKKLEIAGFEILPLITPERNGTTAGITLAKDF